MSAASTPDRAREPRSRGTCILVADDEPSIRRLLRRKLEGRGHGVREAENGRAALEVFEREPVDLVVTDLVMPEMEGLETIRALRARNPRVPIIAISAPDRRHYLESALAFGAAAIFEKPLALAAFADAIDELLQRPARD